MFFLETAPWAVGFECIGVSFDLVVKRLNSVAFFPTAVVATSDVDDVGAVFWIRAFQIAFQSAPAADLLGASPDDQGQSDWLGSS